ncbi:MAG: response regulator transcription factor [Chitinophagaceae bacterium]
MHKINVLVIDDHKMIREMMMKLFAHHKDIEIAGEAEEFDTGVQLATTVKPDIILLDINLRDKSGLDAVPLLRKASAESKIIGISMHIQPAVVKKMLALGARGYITKSSSLGEIEKAIIAVMNGKVYVCDEIKNIIANQALLADTGKSLGLLTARELEIVRLIKQGNSSKQIGETLGIAKKTVEVHRLNIMKKLNIKNAAALVNFINLEDPYF